MNKSILLTGAVVCAILIGCATAPKNISPSTDNVPPVVGGYSPIDVADSLVTDCAAFAVKTTDPSGALRLVSITSVQRQVVAGMNYMINMVITRNGKTERATATVWSKLDGTKELTAWESKP